MNVSDECQAFGCYAIGTEYMELELDNDEVIKLWTCEGCAKKLSSLRLFKLDNTERNGNRNDRNPKDHKLQEYCEDLKENFIKIDKVTPSIQVEVQ